MASHQNLLRKLLLSSVKIFTYCKSLVSLYQKEVIFKNSNQQIKRSINNPLVLLPKIIVLFHLGNFNVWKEEENIEEMKNIFLINKKLRVFTINVFYLVFWNLIYKTVSLFMSISFQLMRF